MDANVRKHLRRTCQACRFEVLQVNGAEPVETQRLAGAIENISKGGFRFVTTTRFELEDRIRARLFFPDGYSQETLGRICYCDEVDGSGGFAYGFSILEGFVR